jgi:hypothetical protein
MRRREFIADRERSGVAGGCAGAAAGGPVDTSALNLLTFEIIE